MIKRIIQRSSAVPKSDLSLDRKHHWRFFKDTAAKHGVAVGGISVIIAILLIFFYLFYVVFPLFIPAKIERVANFPLPGSENQTTLYLALEEQNEIGARFTDTGEVVFFKAQS
ncbi:hypothetical protein, partial [Kaarinaea lacus]